MKSSQALPLIMISAMYENGGNTTHRFLDGHPQLHAYPFESQLGTSFVSDYLSSFVPFKYRWPEFPMNGTPAQDYEAFFDEEMKVMLRTPTRSKFKDADMQIDEGDRRKSFASFLSGRPRTRANIVSAFFHSTFDAWKNLNRSGKEKYYLGYSPVVALDTDKILEDYPNGHVVHVVRNPYSGYADTKKRPFPLSLTRYTWTWNFMQHIALTQASRYPKNFHLVRFEDVVANPRRTLSKLCKRMGMDDSESLSYTSWNGERLKSVYPWGTIVTPTPEANMATLKELSKQERADIKSLSRVMLKQLDYDSL